MTRASPASAATLHRLLVRPIQAFVQTEASGGLVLLAAVAVALALANSPWGDDYSRFWARPVSVDFDVFALRMDLRHVVNDGVMTLFFFVVGLEIKRELLAGELASLRRAALPVAAAAGGMAVPALVYTAWNAGGTGAAGWGIPMATDIAFALGVLALVGPRVPFSLRVFLLALAIADDLGAIAVIAVFYTDSISLPALAWAAGIFVLVVALRVAGVRHVAAYAAAGLLLWLAVHESGIHATIAGVLLAALTPARAGGQREAFAPEASVLLGQYGAAHARHDAEAEAVVLAELGRLSEERTSPLDRLEHALHPWVSYGAVPLFALANAGLDLSAGFLREAATGPVGLGVTMGLVLGKPVGVLGGCWLAVRLRAAALPPGAGWRDMAGAGLLAGIGFTVSLFVAGLAFDSPVLQEEARAGIFVASLVAGAAGFAWLRFLPRRPL